MRSPGHVCEGSGPTVCATVGGRVVRMVVEDLFADQYGVEEADATIR